MSAWSLEAFVGPLDIPLDVDAIAHTIADISNDRGVVFSDSLCPFSGERLGVRLDWPNWSVKVMVRHGPEVVSDAEFIARSRASPASTRRRIHNCNVAVRVIFGPDDSRSFTNVIINVAEYLNEISDNRTYDPQQRRFWPIDR
jgi:hypothetical protein